jgi:hypothetical protein
LSPWSRQKASTAASSSLREASIAASTAWQPHSNHNGTRGATRVSRDMML